MSKPDVIMAVMKLTRAMRRGPMRPAPGAEPPMGGGRLMTTLKENSNVSSRELAELLDIRPSSLTELLNRLERDGLLKRTADENDKRVVRVALTEKGEQLESEIAAERNARLEEFAACFSDEEAVTFCEMCDRLSVHLEGLDQSRGECGDYPPPPPPHDFMHGCPPPHHFHGPCGAHLHHHGHHHDMPFPPMNDDITESEE